MEYKDIIAGIRRSGDAGDDLCARVLGIPADQVRENVIITPGWGPEKVPGLGEAVPVKTSGTLFESFQLWTIENDGVEITYIKTGFGAPMIMDALLPLGTSHCKRILFISSTGGMAPDMGIGDIVLPEYSVCGDGASRFIASEDLKDVFGEISRPDATLLRQLEMETQKVCGEQGVKWHRGKTACSDTILMQYIFYIHHILELGCNTLDMESAVAFRVASLMNKPLAAFLNVSDNTYTNKSLIGAIPREELEYRQQVRGKVMPRIILNLFRDCATGQ